MRSKGGIDERGETMLLSGGYFLRYEGDIGELLLGKVGGELGQP